MKRRCQKVGLERMAAWHGLVFGMERDMSFSSEAKLEKLPDSYARLSMGHRHSKMPYVEKTVHAEKECVVDNRRGYRESARLPT